MAFLRLDGETGEVFVSDEGMLLSCIKGLLQKDKTKGRTYYNNALKYIYHTYKKDHDLSFLSFNSRRQRVVNDYVPGYSSDKFENDLVVVAVIKEFQQQQYTPNELFYESIKNDFDEMRDYIKEIPLKKKIKIEEVFEVPVEHEGQTYIKEVAVKKDIFIDNSKEKFDALKRAAELIDLSNTIQQKVKEENKKKKVEDYQTMLEDGRL